MQAHTNDQEWANQMGNSLAFSQPFGGAEAGEAFGWSPIEVAGYDKGTSDLFTNINPSTNGQGSGFESSHYNVEEGLSPVSGIQTDSITNFHGQYFGSTIGATTLGFDDTAIADGSSVAQGVNPDLWTGDFGTFNYQPPTTAFNEGPENTPCSENTPSSYSNNLNFDKAWIQQPVPLGMIADTQVAEGVPEYFPISHNFNPGFTPVVPAAPMTQSFSGFFPSSVDVNACMDFTPTVSLAPATGYTSNSIDFNPIADLDAPASVSIAPASEQVLTPSIGVATPILCTQGNCTASFKRTYERVRHEATAHGINQGLHLCPIQGCNKNQGAGYSRADKVKEHLWKKHAHLGFTRSR
ncbi:hypothetical protein LSUE1_G009107 [Lachnellula suecica]|uniref:C2H2-type domain-containing protein n=1 Tax=Lachnellula suecica TaxID=602035 RepID=A0A8T9C312_9HELO|nr:hypothetical protein LSUE1_G009107 [Lachnellula suecica]